MAIIKTKHFKGQMPEGQSADWMSDKDWEDYWKYVEECRKDGTYGQEIESEIHLNNDPFWDKPSEPISYGKIEVRNFKGF